MMNLLSSKAILLPCVLVQNTIEIEALIINVEGILSHSKVWDAKEWERIKSAIH